MQVSAEKHLISRRAAILSAIGAFLYRLFQWKPEPAPRFNCAAAIAEKERLEGIIRLPSEWIAERRYTPRSDVEKRFALPVGLLDRLVEDAKDA